MYCSGCGNQIAAELNFCNRCGAKTARADSSADKTSSAAEITGAVSYVGGFGLIAFIFIVLVLVKLNVEPGALVAVSFFYLAALFGICFMLIRQANMMFLHSKERSQNDLRTGELNPATTAQLEAPKTPAVPIPSVTEHTTHNFTEIPAREK